MNTDIRLSLSIRSHPKTKKLKFMLGSDGVLSFIWLLMFVAESKPDGDLAGMDEVDIALAADWGGEPSDFVNALTRIGFLDRAQKGFQIHDWKQHNPWAANAKDRSDQARKAASARWHKKYGCDTSSLENQQHTRKSDAPSIDEHCSESESALQSEGARSTPIPTPTPVPIESGTSSGPKSTSDYPLEFEEVWEVYPKRNGSNPKKAAFFAYKQRINEGVDAEAILLGLQRYIAWSNATNKTGTEIVMQAKRFFGPGREWENEWALPSQPLKLPRDNRTLWEIRNALSLPFEYENLDQCHSEIRNHLAKHPEQRILIEGFI